MPRTYEQIIIDLPQVDVLDWELIQRVDELLRPYLSEGELVRFEAVDSRGVYSESDFTSFRAEVERQEEVPNAIAVSLRARSHDWREFQVRWTEGHSTVALVRDADEPS